MAGFVTILTEGMMDIQSSLKKLPSVEKLLEEGRIATRIGLLSRRGITALVRASIDRFRKRLLDGELGRQGGQALFRLIADDIALELDRLGGTGQRRVINATGVILHTNLGRAVLGTQTCEAIARAASGYVDLEVDLETGKRTSRVRRVQRLLSLITGTEDALVVNNNAAAVLLAVNTFAAEGAVAVSRGELVEIGGSFRLPEILASAAGRIIEVGTTNRTHLEDYVRAIEEGATLLLKVHASNYRILGYTNEVSLKSLAELGKAHNVVTMYDQGSGILYPLDRDGVMGEASIETILASGVDLVCFSTDKVLGATQGGALIGPRSLVGKMRGNHLSRALRLDKLAIAGLEQVLMHLWLGEYESVPALRMITTPVQSIAERAERLVGRLEGARLPGIKSVAVITGESSIGGGSFPINPLPTALVELTIEDGTPEAVVAALRKQDPAILVRIKGNTVLIDLRSVFETEEDMLVDGVVAGIGDIYGRE
ncbi:MAG: L-seryl-tRNA(Sec) selenium transferase [bacterium]|nr:MAG: L-seryl-tRNA(Sec) selenium transferase [bacterium]